MKKVLLVIGLMLMTCQAVYGAEYATGNDFVNRWREYKKDDVGQRYSSFDVAYYMGYVDGISDTGYGIWFAYPKGTTTSQLCHVVGKWIDDHPERWANTPWVIVVTALQEAFPLQKK